MARLIDPAIPETSTLQDPDLFYVVTDPAGTPTDRKITRESLAADLGVGGVDPNAGSYAEFMMVNNLAGLNVQTINSGNTDVLAACWTGGVTEVDNLSANLGAGTITIPTGLAGNYQVTVAMTLADDEEAAEKLFTVQAYRTPSGGSAEAIGPVVPVTPTSTLGPGITYKYTPTPVSFNFAEMLADDDVLDLRVAPVFSSGTGNVQLIIVSGTWTVTKV